MEKKLDMIKQSLQNTSASTLQLAELDKLIANIRWSVGVLIFSNISERNNDYSDTLDFRRGSVGEVGLVTFFVLEFSDYESVMLIYLYV